MKLDWLPDELRPLVEKFTDAQIVALVLFGEARSEPVAGVVAVGCVIRNRVKADLHNDKKPDWWGENYSGVCLQAWQFSCLHPKGGAKNYKLVKGFAERLASGQPINEPQSRQCVWVAHGIIGDYALDNVKGATHYHTAAMSPRPSWVKGHTPVVQHFGHVFYTGIT